MSSTAVLKEVLRERRGEFLVGHAGYTELRKVFRDNLTSEEPAWHFLIIEGNPGMGKSTLARYLAREVAGMGAFTAWVDDAHRSPIQILSKIATDLTRAGLDLPEFSRTYERWYLLHWQFSKDPYALWGLSAILQRLSRYHPYHPPISPTQVDGALFDFIAGPAQDHLAFLSRFLEPAETVSLLHHPEVSLLHALAHDLAGLPGHPPAVIIFDDWEKMSMRWGDWLEEAIDVLRGTAPHIFLLLTAEALSSTPTWDARLPDSLVLALSPFDEEQTGLCCARYGLENSAILSHIYSLSQGLPAWTTLLAAAFPHPPRDAGLADDPAGQLASWFEMRSRADLLQHAALVRSWDRAMLKDLLGRDVSNAEFEWLLSLPSVQSDGFGWAFTPAIRRELVRWFRAHSLSIWNSTHARALEYFEGRRSAIMAAPWHSPEWLRFTAEACFHHLCLGSEEDIGQAAGQLLECLLSRIDIFPAFLRVWEEAGAVLPDRALSELAAKGWRALEAYAEGGWPAMGDFLAEISALPAIPPRGRACLIVLSQLAGLASYPASLSQTTVEDHLADNEAAWLALALLHVEGGDFEPASEAARQAVTVNPGSVPAHLLASDVHAREAKWDEAVQDAQLALGALSEAGPICAAHYRLAQLLIHRNSDEEGLEHFRRAFWDFPPELQQAAAYLERGHLLHRIGRAEEACRDYVNASGLAGGHAAWTFDIYVNLSSAHRARRAYLPGMEAAEKAFRWLLDRPIPPDETSRPQREELVAAHVNRGNCRLLVGEVQGAIWDFDQALLRDASNSLILSNRGTAYLMQKLPSRAEYDFNQVIERNPDFAWGWYNRGIARAMQGRMSHARDDFKRAAGLLPDEPAFAHNLALAYFHLRAFRRALAWFRHAIALDPEYAMASYHQGLCCQELGMLEEAVAAFGNAIQSVERSPAQEIPRNQPALAYLARGHARTQLGDHDGAMADFRYVLELLNRSQLEASLPAPFTHPRLDDFGFTAPAVPLDALALKGWGDVLAAQRNFSAALEPYDQALELAHNMYPEGLASRAAALCALRRHADALRDWELALQHLPTKSDWYVRMGMEYEHLHRYDDALAAYERAIELAPAHGEAYLHLANLSRRRKFWHRAVDSYRMAELFGRRDPELYWGRGEALLARGQSEAALADFNRALGEDPACARAFWGRARALLRMGKLDGAITEGFNALGYFLQGRLHRGRNG